MTSRVLTLRSSTKKARPSGRAVGELYVNFADQQIGVVGPSGNIDLLAVRNFSTTTDYAVGDLVAYAGKIYAAAVAVTAGAWNAAQWTNIGGAYTLPAATAAALGGVLSTPAVARNFVTGIAANGALTHAEIPAANATQLGGVKSITRPDEQFITGFAADGTPQYAPAVVVPPPTPAVPGHTEVIFAVPIGVNMIVLSFSGFYMTGSGSPIAQVGTATTWLTSGYSSGATNFTGNIYNSNGIIFTALNGYAAAHAISGQLILTNCGGGHWVSATNGNLAKTLFMIGFSTFSLTGDLRQLKITSTVATDKIGGGAVSVMYS